MDWDIIGGILAVAFGLAIFGAAIVGLTYNAWVKNGYAYRRFGVWTGMDKPKKLVKIVAIEAAAVGLVYTVTALIIGTEDGISSVLLYVAFPLAIVIAVVDQIVLSRIRSRIIRKRIEEWQREMEIQTQRERDKIKESNDATAENEKNS